MPKNDIGGFFVSLGLNPDKASFETGNKLVDNVANSFNKLIGAARNAAVVLAGTAVATGMVESAAYKTAEKIGISTETLNLWKASAKIAGVDANGLTGAMGSLADVMGRMRIDGAGLEQFTRKLSELGLVTDDIDIAKMLDMAPDELMTDILRKAQEASAKAKKEIAEANKILAKNPKNTDAQKKLSDAQKEQQRISVIVGDILGEAGQDFYIELERQGKTIDQFLKGAGRTVFTTAADNQKGANFAVEVNTLKAELQSIGALIGDNIGGELTPYLKEINKWIQDNGDSIKATIENMAKLIGNITELLAPVVSASLEHLGLDLNQVSNGLNKLFEGEISAGLKEIFFGSNFDSVTDEISKKNGNPNLTKFNTGARTIPVYGALVHGADAIANKAGLMSDEEYESLWGKKGSVKEAKKIKKANDGILRPDGSLTQVAPDDWVFAVRNLGDLAKAFVPQNIVPEASGANTAQLIPEFRVTNITQSSPETHADRRATSFIKDSQETRHTQRNITPLTDTTINENITQNYSTESKAAPLLQNEPEEPRLIRESPTRSAPEPLVQDRKSDFMTNTVLTDLSAYVRSLSTAFIPQTHAPAPAPSEYVIHQTFNISGSNDMPQIIKEQAYKGTQDGLLQLMNKSSQRLQLMSGIR